MEHGMVHIPVDRVRGRIGGPKRGGKGKCAADMYKKKVIMF